MPQGIVCQEDIVQQLVYIYDHFEYWHAIRMPYDEAIDYHRRALEDGSIHVHVVNGEVLGYYQREFLGHECFLMNVFAFDRDTFKAMKKHFFETMPEHITCIVGEKQRLGGIWRKAMIRRQYGKH